MKRESVLCGMKTDGARKSQEVSTMSHWMISLWKTLKLSATYLTILNYWKVRNNMSGIDFIVYGILSTIVLIGTTEFVIGLLLIREYDKIQEEKEQQNEQK